jgi:hypothetical protein
MSVLVVVIATFVLSGAFVILIVSRIMSVDFSFARFVGAFLGAAILSGAVASIVVLALARGTCEPGKPCEYAGFLEGGLFVAMIWLGCYSVTYIVSAIMIARVHARRPLVSPDMTPNTSFERTREG